ncbi:glycosyltransferase [Niallia nealsonii AAU1]|nr:glycosyltransferase [Niallia nealsonii AAU1]
MEVKLSIIVPVYNVEKFLGKCLDSLFNQTLKEFEIVAVNDCSTDYSLEILKKYKDVFGEKLQIIDSEINSKQGGARNFGIQAARGEFIGFVDPDDYIESSMFEKMYNKACSENADIVTCDYFEVANNKIVYINNDIPSGIVDKQYKKNILQRKYGWELWQQIYKKDLFISNSIQFSPHLYVTDLEIGALLFMYSKKVSKVNEALYYYVKHDSATTTFKLNDEKIYDLIIISDKRLQHFKERNLYNTYKDEIDFIYFWHICVVSVPRCVINFSKPQYKKMDELKLKIQNNIPDIKRNKYFTTSNLFSKVIFYLLFKNKVLLVALLKTHNIIPYKYKKYIKKFLKS